VNEMSCAELVERLTEYLEDAMPAPDRARLEAHLGECPDCVRYVEQLRRTVDLVGALREDDLEPTMEHRLRAALAAWRAGG
jgi:anti-sigma factor RsiW